MIATLEKCNTEIDQRDFPPISFKSVAIDHAYVLKKNTKEFQSVDGILKYSSLHKHYELLPSVVIITAGFNVEWQTLEWNRLSESLLDKVNRIRDQLKGREVKVVVVTVKIGSGQIAPDILEERIGNLRRHLSLEIQRTFLAISLSDVMIQPLTSSVRKLSKNLRELSFLYYNHLEKRARFLLKTARIRGSNEGILTARYSFKLAYFLSFQGSKLQSLKYYKQCFDSLLGVVLHVDEELLDQLKCVAEFAHFKICNMLLQIGSVKESIAQFVIHITTFTKVYSELLWRHFSWISDQYIVFLQLLDLYRISNTMLTTESFDRFFFLQNAIKFSLKREETFHPILLSESSINNHSLSDNNMIKNNNDNHNKYNDLNCNIKENENEIRIRNQISNLVIMPANYVGATLVLIDPDLGSDSALVIDINENNNSNPELLLKYLSECERKFDLKGLIFKLIKRCDDYLISSTSINSHRRNNLNIILSQQLIKNGEYEQALNSLLTITDLLKIENWIRPLIPILRNTLSCSLLLGKPLDYISAAMHLYSIGTRSKNSNRNNNSDNTCDSNNYVGEDFRLDSKEKEILNDEIICLLKSDLIHNKIYSSISNKEKILTLPLSVPKSTKESSVEFFNNNFESTIESSSSSPSNLTKRVPCVETSNYSKINDNSFPNISAQFYRKKNFGIAASVDRPSQHSLPLRSHIGEM